MALIKCRECGTEISSKASVCPSCGFKPHARRWWLVAAVVAVPLASLGVRVCKENLSRPSHAEWEVSECIKRGEQPLAKGITVAQLCQAKYGD
jgi:RNA polymerase subunit RPABC4/transcription elongation factor Spt4